METTQASMAAIAQRIRNRRLELGYSYQDLADLTGMNKSSLQRYESGGIANVPLHRLRAIAGALNVSPEWLMGWDTDDYHFTYSATDPQIDEIAAICKGLTAQGLEYVRLAAEIVAGNPLYQKEKAPASEN